MSQEPATSGAPHRHATFPRLGRVCRVGLATRGNTRLDAADVVEALERGADYLNWCGHSDGLSAAVRGLGERRRDVFVAVQLEARDAAGARRELDSMRRELGTERLDVVTYYYVESEEEWREILARGGAAEAVEAERSAGRVGAIGVTSHQRGLAARIARSGRVDMLMVRYNAAHRGAEEEVFPHTRELGMPVVTYTGLRWGALPRQTPDDPPGFVPPPAPEWYRFVLANPDVTVGLMAPNGRAELEADLALLDEWRAPTPAELDAMRAHGERVRRHAGRFP